MSGPLRIILFVALALAACGDPDSGGNSGGIASNNDADPTPAWMLGATDVSPEVIGSEVLLIDGNTIQLTNSEPAGWSVEFVAEEPFEENTPYVSDNVNGRVSATATNPDDERCDVPAGTAGASLHTASLSPIATGSGTVSGECFGAPEPGISLNVAFGEASAIGADQ